jgi:hypothetical protein
MAFNLNAFSGGLGGLLQQMMAGQQQSQAMQQKMVDQEIPLFNQQRAYQKESADQAYEALKRRNDLDMMPLLAQLQRGQIQGQDIANRTGTANLGILNATAPALSAAPGLTNQVTTNSINAGANANDVAQAVGAEQKRAAGLAPKKEVLATEDELRKEIDAKTSIITSNMAIMVSPSATTDQKRIAQSAIVAARQSLGTLQSTMGKRYAAAGGQGIDVIGAAGMFPQGLMTSPLPKIKISPFNPAIKAVNAELSKGLTEGVRTGDYVGGSYISNGKFNAAKATTPSLDVAKAVTRQLDGAAVTRMFGTLEQNEADPAEYFKAYHGITLSPHEVSVKRLTPENKKKLVQSLSTTFTEPTDLSDKVRDNYNNLLNTIADYFKTTAAATTTAKGTVDGEKQKVIAGAIAAMQAGYEANVKLALANMRTAEQQLRGLETSVTGLIGKSASDILTLVPEVLTKYSNAQQAAIIAYQRAHKAKYEMDNAYSVAFTKVPKVNAETGQLENNFESLLSELKLGNEAYAKFGNTFTGGSAAVSKTNGKEKPKPKADGKASDNSTSDIGFGGK